MADETQEQSQVNSESEQSNANSQAYTDAENELFGELEGEAGTDRNPLDDSGLKLTDQPPEGFQAGEPEKEVKTEPEVKEEVKTEPEVKEEVKTDPLWDDTITLATDNNNKLDLVKVDFGDGLIGYVPEAKKADYLRQSDYTRKTQEIADKENNLNTILETERKKVAENYTPFILEYQAMKYGGQFTKPMPLESEVVTAAYDEAERAKQVEDYRKQLTEWQTEKTKFDTENYNVQARMAHTKQVNDAISVEFDKGLGQKWNTSSSALIPEMMQYINPTITHGQQPMPKDALEIFYKGKNFDKLVEARITDEKKKWMDELAAKVNNEPAPRTTQNQPAKSSKKTEPQTVEEELAESYWG